MGSLLHYISAYLCYYDVCFLIVMIIYCSVVFLLMLIPINLAVHLFYNILFLIQKLFYHFLSLLILNPLHVFLVVLCFYLISFSFFPIPSIVNFVSYNVFLS